MAHKKDKHQTGSKKAMSPRFLKSLLKLIGNLSRTGMEAGNIGNFEKAFLNMEEALSLSRDLEKKCLEAKLLNNLGLLYTQYGAWEDAMGVFDQSMTIVKNHYGTRNYLYKTLQKNIGYLFNLNVSTVH